MRQLSYHQKIAVKILEELLGCLYVMGPQYQPAVDAAEKLLDLVHKLNTPVNIQVNQSIKTH